MFDPQVLSYLLQIAKDGSITQAAQNLYISQPRLSSVVKQFEDEVGFQVFIRSAQGVSVTDDGAKFLRMAQGLVSQFEELEETYINGQTNRLKISLSVTRSYQVLKKVALFMNKYEKKYPELKIRFKECSPFQVIEDVSSGFSDFGVLHFFDSQSQSFNSYIKSLQLVADPFYEREYLLVMSKDNPLANVESITKSDIIDQVLVIYGDYETAWLSYEGIEDMTDVLATKKRMLVYDRSSAYGALKLCPNSIMWASGLSDDTLEQYNLVLRYCDDVHVNNKAVMIKRKNAELSPIATELYKTINGIDWTESISMPDKEK